MESEQQDALVALEAVRAAAGPEPGSERDPLSLLANIQAAENAESYIREILFARFCYQAPLVFWSVAKWAARLTEAEAGQEIQRLRSFGWPALQVTDGTPTPCRTALLTEVARRFDAFKPSAPWGGDDPDTEPLTKQRYVFGRELARACVLGMTRSSGRLDGTSKLLREVTTLWPEWSIVAEVTEHSDVDLVAGTRVALERAIYRRVSPASVGIGRTPVLLVDRGPSPVGYIGYVTATVVDLDKGSERLGGIVVPDITLSGVISMDNVFIRGVLDAWTASYKARSDSVPRMLVFSVSPRLERVVEHVTGRSAEASVLAAIQSALTKRVLRLDAAASASVKLGSDSRVLAAAPLGPVKFGRLKGDAAAGDKIDTVVVHRDDAENWTAMKRSRPRLIPSMTFGEVQQTLEERRLWWLAAATPMAIWLGFLPLAGVWQLWKSNASDGGIAYQEVEAVMPFVEPALLGTELVCCALCVGVLWRCYESIRASLDSSFSASIALGISTALIAATTWLPVGVRDEGLLDNPMYSVLFGQPGITPAMVSKAGGGGLLVLHAIAQSLGFVTVLFGAAAISIRLSRTRVHLEPLFEDRRRAVRRDWSFATTLGTAFAAIVVLFCLARNALWHAYLVALPNVPMVASQSDWQHILAPLVSITIVLLGSGGIMWFALALRYIRSVLVSAEENAGLPAGEMLEALPPLARLIARFGTGKASG